MSPRGASTTPAGVSTRSTRSPYSRRPSTAQPKSTRQQFSACGACRMRRVRCDLKDISIAAAGPNPSCSNCKERNIKCVDEFADVKAVKLLRRGRRLQQVEAIYGKTSDAQNKTASSSPSDSHHPAAIPNLRPEFFASAFWLWFAMQRPILDPVEFPSRFYAHTKGTQSLGHEGGIIAMLLVVWAASFGLDERGLPHDTNAASESLMFSVNPKEEININESWKTKDEIPDSKQHDHKDKVDTMVREVLDLIDFHGVMRRPTLDGIQALLLLLPLLEDAAPLERIAIHEATLSQVLAVCTSTLSTPGQNSFLNDHSEAMQRARIFWYAHTQEGLLTGMKGQRFVLTNDDLDVFQNQLPSFGSYGATTTSSYQGRSHLTLAKHYEELSQMSRVPLRLNGICRRIHSVITGAKAARCVEEHGLVEANGMRETWRELDRCWNELDALKETLPLEEDSVRRVYIAQYACAWQIFIFECHNLVRESLKQYMSTTPTQQIFSSSQSPPRSSSHSLSSSPYLSPQQLHIIAHRKCLNRLPYVISILQHHLSSGAVEDSAVFRWDAGLIRDGCFFAAYLAATVESDYLEVSMDDLDIKESGLAALPTRYSTEESVAICMATLARMKWVFSKNEERQQTIKMLWGNRKGRRIHQSHRSEPDMHYRHAPFYSQQSVDTGNSQQSTMQSERPSLPPLSMFANSRRVESAPSTSYTTDGAGNNANGWPCYTPPGTSTSVTTSTSTGMSARGSPAFASLAPYKSDMDDPFYHTPAGDIDQFSFNVPIMSPAVRDTSVYHHRTVSSEIHALSNSTTTGYLGQTFSTFGENCSGGYH